MEDLLQIRQAQLESDIPLISIQDQNNLIVSYNVRTESVTLQEEEFEEETHLKLVDMDDSPPLSDAESANYDTVLLAKEEEKGCQSCCSAYRSPNPEKKLTLFAVVLLLVLFLVYILNQADRLVLPVAIPSGLRCEGSVEKCRHSNNDTTTLLEYLSENNSNKSDSNTTEDCIHFTDYEQGLLTGPAFTVIYVVAGLPLARLADTRSRPLVLLIGLIFWSVMVFLTGFTVAFWQLLLLRIFLGIGEAACNPVAYSLLADFYPPHHRAFALSIYHYGVYVGGALGWMIARINEVLRWRWTFRILGIAGFVTVPVAIVALWEPKSVREKRKERQSGKKEYTIFEVIMFLVKCPPYWLLLVAGSIRNIPGYALGAWLPTFFVRQYGVSTEDFSIPVGLVVLFGGGLGCFLGGFISDRLSSRWKNAKAYVIAVSQVLAAPALAGVILAPYSKMSYGILFLAYMTAETWLGPAAAIVQDLCMPAMRAQASAIYIGVITIVASVGPVIIPAIMNRAPFLDPCTNGVGYSLLIIVPLFYLLSAALFAALGVVIVCWDKRTSFEYKPFQRAKEVSPVSP